MIPLISKGLFREEREYGVWSCFFEMTSSTADLIATLKDRAIATLVVAALIAFATTVPEVDGAVEEIDVTPSNTNGIEIGELSLLQFVLFMLVILKLVTLYSFGVLPVEVDLGGTFSGASSKRSITEEAVSHTTTLRVTFELGNRKL